MEKEYGTEDAMWRDAYGIAWVGAANPAAVATTLAKHVQALQHRVGTREAEKHDALRAMAGHLVFLFGRGLGPPDESLTAVEQNARRLGLIS